MSRETVHVPTKTKRVKLDNGKTMLIEVPVKKEKNDVEKLKKITKDVKFMKPCD